MRPIWKTVSVLGLLILGYVLGANAVFSPKPLGAQGAPAEGGPSEDSRKKLQDAFTAIKAAAETLEQENLYVPATTSLNVFSVMAGGLNAKQDLEDGRGVDPETFAALYAGEAIPDIKEHLDHDDQGRLTYKGKVVRIYPKQRMKKIFQERLRYMGGGAAKRP
ncbi:MAG: hypothetical protein IAG10_02555 [Planctomycetaceae bacterium]|nr:hypothetical protein [Planctomycetaceae bacterium]